MKPKNKCHKCGAAACCHLEHRKRWECESTATMGGFDQSSLCKERVKVQKLKREVEKQETEAHDLKKQMLGIWNHQTRAEKAEAELAAEKAKNIYLLTAMADDAEKHEAELKKLQNTYDGMRARHSLELSVIEAFLFDDHDEDGDLNGLPNQWYDYETMVSSKAQMVVIERNQLKAELAEAIDQRDKALAAMIAYEAAAHRTVYAEAKLAKRDKALEQAKEVASLDFSADNSGICVGSKSYLGWGTVSANPELAEWLQSRSKT